MLDSAKIYRMDNVRYTGEHLCRGHAGTGARQSHGFLLHPAHRHPRLWRYGRQRHKNPIEVYIACWEWGKYLGEEALAEGVDVCVSSWNRMAPNTLPALAKAGANYMNSQLIKMEAIANGYAEGIALDTSGYVSEGSGENIFVVRDGKILTPPLGASVLPGITRDYVLTHCARARISRWWKPSSRAKCSTSPMKFSSPARPPKSRHPLHRPHHHRQGQARTHRRASAEGIFGIIDGSRPDVHNWLSPVHAAQPAGVK